MFTERKTGYSLVNYLKTQDLTCNVEKGIATFLILVFKMEENGAIKMIQN